MVYDKVADSLVPRVKGGLGMRLSCLGLKWEGILHRIAGKFGGQKI